MTRRTSTGLFAACAALSASSLAMLTTTDARACGGCFTQTSTPGGSESTIVTAHRMALSVSTERTVLWDQIQYQGAPEEFAWVLPVKPGTTINLASDAFFEALDAATTAHASPPPGVVCTQTSPGMNGNVDGYGYYGGCSITGCGSGRSLGEVGAGGSGGSTTITIGVPVSIPTVEVVHQESIGPYEAVVLSSNKPGALHDWLLDHGFGIDPTMEPIVDAYEAESFDFVALRLIPGADVRQMRPVRVISPGAAPVLPLRMVAAGTGANVAMTLFLLGEGRWSPSNFPAAEIYQGQVEWDFDTSSSNYAPLRAGALAAGDGSSWLTTYSKPGALLGQVFNPVSMTNVTYQTSLGQSANSIAELYVLQALANGEITDTSCLQGIYNAANGYGKVVDPCGDQTQEGGAGGAGGSTATGGSGGAGGSTATGGGGGSTATGTGGVGGSTATGGVGGSTATGGAGGSTDTGTGGVGGATATGGSGGAAPADTCAHSVCSAGDGLEFGCSACATAICQANPACCLDGWDAGCVGLITPVCHLECGLDGQLCPGDVQPGDVLASTLACGEVDDMAIALVGMHPTSVWVTRLEANLPRAALANDLQLQAAGQSPVENWIQASTFAGDPCNAVTAGAPVATQGEPRKRPPFGADFLAAALTLATLLGAGVRRALRRHDDKAA